MLWARDNVPSARFVVTAACDTPFFPLDLVSALREAAGGERSAVAIAASAAGAHPTFGVWPVSLAGAMETGIAGMRRMVA